MALLHAGRAVQCRTGTRPVAPRVNVARICTHRCQPRGLVITSFKAGEGAADAAPAAAAAEPHWKQAVAELDRPHDAPGRKIVIAQVAPAVRVAIPETCGLAPGATSPGQLVEGLRRLGFDIVFDTMFAADLTIMEEAHELLHRLETNLAGAAPDGHAEPLPMFTSCCPGWVGLLEKSYPDIIPHLSTCRSPQMMMGSLVKTYLAEKLKVKASDICMVSVMPCTRKQGEADRAWYNSSEQEGARDVDHVITTAELGNILKERSINLPELPESGFDEPLGVSSGAAMLFGTTGGVMEAALRTAYEVVTQTELPALDFEAVRGLDGIKESVVTLKPASGTKLAELLKSRKAAAVANSTPLAWDGGAVTEDGTALQLRIAVANGLGNAKKLVTKLQSGEAKYDFVEIMACPSGCTGGGGQPRSTDKQITQKRQAAVYSLDERRTIRRSHANPAVAQVYKQFLEAPNSHKAHKLLHTHYVAGGAEAE